MHLKRKKGCGFGGDVGKVREKLGKDKLFSEYTVWKIIFNLNHQKKTWELDSVDNMLTT